MILLYVPIFALAINKIKLGNVLGCSKISNERIKKNPQLLPFCTVDPAMGMHEFIERGQAQCLLTGVRFFIGS